MAIPDLLTDQERIAYGFVLEDHQTARHVSYGVWRYRCSECGLWVRKVDHVDGWPICLKCLGHHRPRRSESIHVHA